MGFVYTEHAEENIAERKLDKVVIERLVETPETLVAGKFGRMIAQKVLGTKLLRVIYEQQNNTYIIITAYYADPERYR